MLGIHIEDIRDAKAEGCSAFRSGRVYRAPLIEWLEKRKIQQRSESDAGLGDERARKRTIVHAMIELARVFEIGALTRDQYFEQGTALVEATGDNDIRIEWVRQTFDWIAGEFPDLVVANDHHPKAVAWLLAVAGCKLGPSNSAAIQPLD